MFNGKKSDSFEVGSEKAPVSTSASLIGAGTTMKGDISSNGDLRIDGTLVGNIHCSAKVVIGANGGTSTAEVFLNQGTPTTKLSTQLGSSDTTITVTFRLG